MYLQIEIIILIALVAILALFLLFIRKQPPPPSMEEGGVRYTHGEREILDKLEEMRERVEKMIPPYGRVGYVPSSIGELKELLGFDYVKLGDREVGNRPYFLNIFEKLDVDYLQAHYGSVYIYVVKRDEKKLIAIGSQYLDYLTYRFLWEFLEYI